MCKTHHDNQDCFPLANGVYFIVIIKKTLLHNENSLITETITRMGVAYAFERGLLMEQVCF